MFLICLIFLSSFIRTKQAALNQAELETAFLAMVNARVANVNALCGLSPLQLAFLCKHNLFLKDKYKYNWKVHLNILAFYDREHPPQNQKNHKLCQTEQITLEFPKNGINHVFYKMLPCFGQQRPIRSNWKDDEYYGKFFVSPSSTWDVMYVFRKEILNTGNVVILVHDMIDGVTFPGDVEPFSELQISSDALYWDTYLNTVETIIYESQKVEAVYVLDMILNSNPILSTMMFHQNKDLTFQKHLTSGIDLVTLPYISMHKPTPEGLLHKIFKDPLVELNIGSLVTVCSSIFSGKVFLDTGFSLNQNRMFFLGREFVETPLRFRFMRGYNWKWQVMHPCRGQPDDGVIQFLISSGRSENSVFVYWMVNGTALPLYYIENFDFTNLRPSDPEEERNYFEPTPQGSLWLGPVL